MKFSLLKRLLRVDDGKDHNCSWRFNPKPKHCNLDWVRALTLSCLVSSSPEPRLRPFNFSSMYDFETSTSNGKIRSVLTNKKGFGSYPPDAIGTSYEAADSPLGPKRRAYLLKYFHSTCHWFVCTNACTKERNWSHT